MYIQNGLTLGYTAQALNLFNSHLFSNVGLTHYFFLLRILNILTHTHKKRGEYLKETNSGVYLKCIFTCYINYLRKLPKMFISPTFELLKTIFFVNALTRRLLLFEQKHLSKNKGDGDV